MTIPSNDFGQLTVTCPECGHTLAQTSAIKMLCEGCGASWLLRENILSVARDSTFYFGEQTQSVMRQGTGWMQELGFSPGFQRYLDSLAVADADYMGRYVAGFERVGFLPLLPTSENGRALDIGSGWGAISLALAQRFEHVVSLDLTMERLIALRTRLRESNLHNVSLIHGGDRPLLPFADNQFDLVVLNGVLEYAGCSTTDDPRESQCRLLREIARVLRPNGSVLIGIENRFALKYFFGDPEDHLGVKFISLVPRWFGKILGKLQGVDFRVYTHSITGYRSLLNSAGFRTSSIFVPQPDYRFINRILPASPEKWIEKGWQQAEFLAETKGSGSRLVARSLRALGIAHHFDHNYFITASQARDSNNGVHSILNELRDRTFKRWNLRHLTVSSTGLSLLYLVSESGDKAIGRYPLSPEGAQRIHGAYHVRDRIRRALSERNSQLVNKIPKTILNGAERSDGCWVEAFLPGQSPTKPGIMDLSESSMFAIELSQLSDSVTLDSQNARNIVHSIMPPIKIAQMIDGMLPVAELLIEQLVGRNWKLTPCHGDFWFGNVLMENDTCLSGIVDWEFALLKSLNGLDLLHYLTISRLHRTSENWAGYGHTQKEFFACFSSTERKSSIEAFAASGIILDQDTWAMLQAAVWLNEFRELTAMLPYRRTASWQQFAAASGPRVLSRLEEMVGSTTT